MEQEQNQNSQRMQEEVPMRLLKIKTLSETVYELRVPANMLIKDLRIKVQEVSGVPADRQRMICMGQQLIDTKTVGDYAKDPEQPNWIHLVAKVQQQNANQQPQQQQAQQQQQQQPQQQNNRRPLDMFGGNVQIQQGNLGDLSQILGNLTNLFNIQPGARQQQQQQPNQQSQQPQQNPLIQSASFTLAQPLFQPQPQHSQAQSQTQPQTQQNPQTQSTARSNLVSNQQPITIQRQIQLPHQELLNLGLICNNLMGAQSTFPGPPLPMLPNRSPAAMIGSYLSNWQFQVQRTLPFVHRLAELLQREQYMNLQVDRSSTQALSLEVGRALNELVACTQPLVGILRDIQLDQGPGQARFEQNPNAPAPVLTRPPVQHPMQSSNSQNQSGSTSTNTQNSQNQASNSNTNNTNMNNNSNRNQQQNVSQPNVQATIQVGQVPITSFFSNQQQRNQVNNQPAQNNNTNSTQAQQPGQTTINITQNPNNGANDSLNQLISQISGGQNGEVRIGVMNTMNNDQEIQIVGIGSTHVVDTDSNINLQQVLGNILGNQNINVNASSVNTGNRNNNQSRNNNQNLNESEWEDEEDENTIGIEMSSTINLNGDENLLQNLLQGLGLPNNGNSNITINASGPQVQTTTISGAQAANLLSQLNRQTQQQNQQQQQQNQMPSSQNTNQSSNSSQQQPQNQNSSSQNNTQSQSQQNSQQQQQAVQQQQPQMGFPFMMGGQSGGFNPLSMLMGDGIGGMMNMTVDELIRENMTEQDQEQSESDELIQAIVGQLRISDLVQSFMSGQFTFLNSIQQKIRDQISQRNLGRQEFSEKLAQSLSSYLVVPQQHSQLVYEGLEPEGIALDILETRLPTVYDIIMRDFPQDGTETFSGEFVYEVKKIIGELFTEFSECLHGGLNDLQVIFRAWVNEPITRIMGEGSMALVDSLITTMLWEKVKALILQYQHENNNNQRSAEEQKQNQEGGSNGQMEIENPTQNRAEQEIDLLEDIENELEKDETRFERYNIQLSEEYKKGDLMKKKD
ncbi:ubiquitin family protein (macronuclear) [Tetrahymena thermophila SB210]|uniref:Ubiquitin family protein n=1 Tax=Tetrahymena thermophila (strain SB210) TaxID=312017 RepID=I7MAZ2_TETTS|nr:ubiquitin family protein [Tetrahymena thermophila SB210]EAS06764.2 ubiquitin family protein [Tetrahymena thermophila SB210]|eukprot:XP_001027006.2 ubiquitin family protein [Tetrahymena thermophila SB210]